VAEPDPRMHEDLRRRLPVDAHQRIRVPD